MSLIETRSDSEYLAWWRRRREQMLRPVVKAVTKRELWTVTFHEPHTVPTYAEWRAANSQTFAMPHTVKTPEQHEADLKADPVRILRSVLVDVAARNGLDVEDLTGKVRLRSVTLARQEAMWLAHANTTLSLGQLGIKFKAHHTTILHGIRAHAARHGLPAKREVSP